MADDAIRSFCSEQRELLQLELQSEAEAEEASKSSSNEETSRSHVLHQLQASDVSVGLYGRTVVRLNSSLQELLPAHRFTTGDEVEIRSKKGSGDYKTGVGGVISQVTEESVSVALFSGDPKKQKGKQSQKDKINSKNSEEDDDDNLLGAPPYSLLPKSSLEVHKKLVQALDELERHGVDHPVAGSVVKALFDASSSTPPVIKSNPVQDENKNTTSRLDASQQAAVAFALQPHRPLALLHGPPGSGKTTTVVQLIRQAVSQGNKVLVTAPSNVAVDNVLARLVSTTTDNTASAATKSSHKSGKRSAIRVVRLGHPARLQQDILQYSLEALVQGAEGTEIVADVRRELAAFLKVSNNPRARYADKVTARREIKLLRKEVRSREEGVVTDLLQQAQVVLATCVGAANRKLAKHKFDLVVIDEAAQSLEAACWIPALRGARLVLAGDHCQLPPTIKCKNSKVQTGLGRTMFERVMEMYGNDQVSRMLQVQYRMHENIANWASQALYNGKLSTHESAQGRILAQLDGIVRQDGDEDMAETPLLMIDTAGCAMPESTNAAGSRYNHGEAELVGQHVRRLLDMGVQQNQIAVITPYNGQVEILRTALHADYPRLEIRTVDGFQGGEREAVVLSLVRSSEDRSGGGIGFLRDDRRLNVAVTRAKRHCCLICNSETVSQSSFVKNLIAWIDKHGEQRSALEYMDGSNETQMTSDLLQAQIELEKMMLEEDKKKAMEKKQKKIAEDNKKREALLERVRAFVETGKAGEAMSLSTELSKGDRHAVHELAEDLGVGHCSTGVEGVDRRITISIPQVDTCTERENQTQDTATSADIADDESEGNLVDQQPSGTVFSSLQLDDEDDVEDDEGNEDVAPVKPEGTQSEKPASNLLGDLAKERLQREAQRRRETQKQSTLSHTAPKKKKKKKPKGQRLGGSAKPPPAAVEDDGLDNLDDMAFLDAQIDKVQTSHGRAISASGSNYRTVMNGILLSKPKPPEKKRDARASSALQTKLKQAQKGRQAKGKKKK